METKGETRFFTSRQIEADTASALTFDFGRAHAGCIIGAHDTNHKEVKMGSSGGGGSSNSYYYQQQQLALQREQMAQSQRQHEESLAMQREAMDKPVAAVQKNVSLATEDMVKNQEAERNNLRGIRSTYSLFRKQADEDESGKGTKLGD